MRLCLTVSYLIFGGLLFFIVPNVEAQQAPIFPSLTIYPVSAAPQEFPAEYAKRVALVIGTMLEQRGMNQIDIADKMPIAINSREIADVAEEISQEISQSSVSTDLALQVQLVGTPQSGVIAIRWLITDRSGKVVANEEKDADDWKDSTPRPADPMTCSAYVVSNLAKRWSLISSPDKKLMSGKLSTFWREDAGLPSTDELQAIQMRRQAWSSTSGKPTVTLLIPQRTGSTAWIEVADLATAIKTQTQGDVSLGESSELKVSELHTNEQRVLWDMAKLLKQWVQQKQPASDYIVCVDSFASPSQLHFAHIIICDKEGNWVLVDYLNTHHQDFPSDLNNKQQSIQAITGRLK